MLFAPQSLYDNVTQLSRRDLWDKLHERAPDVEQCILLANPTWKAEHIADK